MGKKEPTKGWLLNPQSSKEIRKQEEKRLKEMEDAAKEINIPSPKGPNLLWGIVSFFTIFDYFTPIEGIAETFYNDPTPLQSNSWTLFIPYESSVFGSGYNANDIEKLLNDNGVKTWGSGFGGGEYYTTVSLKDAKWAEHILLSNNIPITPKFQGAPEYKPALEEKQGWWSWLTGGSKKPDIEVIAPSPQQRLENLQTQRIKRTGHRTYNNIPCLINNAHCDSYAHSMSCSHCGYCSNHCPCYD